MSQTEDESQRDKHRAPAYQRGQDSSHHRAEDEQQGDNGKWKSQRLGPAQVILADRLNILVKHGRAADACFEVRHRVQAALEFRQ